MTKDEKETLADIAADMRSLAQSVVQKNSDPFHSVRLEMAKEAELRRDYSMQSKVMDPSQVPFFQVYIETSGSGAEGGVSFDSAGSHLMTVSSVQFEQLCKAARTEDQKERYLRAVAAHKKNPQKYSSPEAAYDDQAVTNDEKALPTIISVKRA